MDRGSKLILIMLIGNIIFTGCSVKDKITKEKLFLDSENKGVITGKIVKGKTEYLEGAYAYIYKSVKDIPDKPYGVSNASGKEGKYKIEVEKGEYFLLGIKRNKDNKTGKIEKEDYYAYFGGNPINIHPGRIENINLNLTKKLVPDESFTISENKEESGLRGKVVYNGEGLSGAYALVYKTTEYYFRGRPYALSIPTNREGNFKIDLPEGEYYLLAKKKLSQKNPGKKEARKKNESDIKIEVKDIEEIAGPLECGDYFTYYDENPVRVEKGKYTNIILNCIIKIGCNENDYLNLSDTRIEGIITDTNGNPLEGMFAFAQKGVQTIQEKPMPDFISKKSDKKGRFILNLPDTGLYYVAAKNILGRAPRFGDLYGYYVSGNNDDAIFIRKGEIVRDIKIVVSPLN